MDLVTGAAKDLVTGAVGSLISKLGELLNEEYKLQKGVPEKIEFLIKELECADAALRKVAGVPPDQLEEQDRIWAREVREASYDMEDVLDDFLVSAQGDRPAEQTDHQSWFECLQTKMTNVYNMVASGPLKRRKIAVTIDDINKRLQEVTERRHRFRPEDIVSEPAAKSTVDPRLAAMYKEATQLIGIEKPSAQLISMLSLPQGDEASSNNMKMKMVSVVGTGGLGKTTLAKAVYDKVKVGFQCQAFVSVGRDPDLKKVFRDILIGLDKMKYMDSKMTILDEKQLIDELREYLGSKRYFIVIDDIWEIKCWETIKLALVQDNCGTSRVITTTRKLDVASECGEVYKLGPLPFDKSEKLFYTRIFGSEGKCPNFELDEASGKMLKKCDGVPLAIITVASLLVGKSSEEWIEVCRSIVFRDTKKNQQVTDTEWILSLSYNDLPAHLKTCLLYLSAFPEDFVIDKDPLIRMWVAEGFVHSKEPGTRLFEVGEEYFNELINRSMIQVVEEQEGKFIVTGCHLHDMVLDLLRVRSQEENFITISSSNTSIVEGTSSPSSRVRRLARHDESDHEDILLGMDVTHVRTFIDFRGDAIFSSKVQGFRQSLRVLALEHVGEANLEHVEKLLHLRYLSVKDEGHDLEIPEGIGDLKFLQTLDICWWHDFKTELPSSLGLLTRLICLRIGQLKLPNGVIEKLTSLEDLQIRCYEHMAAPFVKELGKLRELRVLNCSFDEGLDKGMQSDLVESLGKLHKIRHLRLRGAGILEKGIWDAAVLPRPLRRLEMHLKFTGLPPCINPTNLPNLTHLADLFVSDMDEQGLKILGALPELCYLSLTVRPRVTITVNDGLFRKLRCLRLYNNSSVSFTVCDYDDDVVAFGSQKGTVQAPAVMPSLQVLHFSVVVTHLVGNNGSCDKLGLEYLPSLQDVRVQLRCSGAFADDVERQEAALRHAIEAHPNRPALRIGFWDKDKMKSRPVDDDDGW